MSDVVLVDIADYAASYKITSNEAYETARNCLIDTLGCGLEALSYPACTKLLGPIVPGTVVPNGAKVPGTPHQLDPVDTRRGRGGPGAAGEPCGEQAFDGLNDASVDASEPAVALVACAWRAGVAQW